MSMARKTLPWKNTDNLGADQDPHGLHCCMLIELRIKVPVNKYFSHVWTPPREREREKKNGMVVVDFIHYIPVNNFSFM